MGNCKSDGVCGIIGGIVDIDFKTMQVDNGMDQCIEFIDTFHGTFAYGSGKRVVVCEKLRRFTVFGIKVPSIFGRGDQHEITAGCLRIDITQGSIDGSDNIADGVGRI